MTISNSVNKRYSMFIVSVGLGRGVAVIALLPQSMTEHKHAVIHLCAGVQFTSLLHMIAIMKFSVLHDEVTC